jgi:adenylate cyclase
MPDFFRIPNLIPLHAWLIEAGTNDVATETLFDGFCGRLAVAGVPIARGFLSIAGLHPLRRAYSLTWNYGRSVEATDFAHDTMATAVWQTSPFRHMLETKTRRLHRRLVGDDAMLDFEVLREFRDAGMSEWVALVYGFGWSAATPTTSQFGVILSWATSKAVGRGDGWSAVELAAIEELSGTLALAIKGNTAPAAAHDLLAAYLGGDAADRVSTGHVQRGSVSRIAAAILCADVRGFTNFAEETAPEEVIRRLNGIFDCVGDPVRAAREILARVETLNATETAAGNPALSLNIALHAGEVTYGNIGTADRLDFTVIGPAVNEAARLEGLCKELGKPILISKSFVRAAQGAREQLLSVGRYPLRGVREAQEVFTIYS